MAFRSPGVRCGRLYYCLENSTELCLSLIPRVLSKVQQDQACVLLVAPVRTCQIWYPMLLRLLIERLVLLPRWWNLMTQPQNGKPHPLQHQIHVAVWYVFGEGSRVKAFQKRLVRSSSNRGLKKTINQKQFNKPWREWTSCESIH